MIHRIQYDNILKRMKDNKAIIIYGPRQAGKTTLIHQLITKLKLSHQIWNGDEPDTRSMLEKANISKLKRLIGRSKLLVIDEAQRIENIGLTIKMIVDNIKGVKVIASGSSAFELANKINEPLTGRKWEFMLFPVSFDEMVKHSSLFEEKKLLDHRLLYGYYPDVLNNPGDEQQILKNLSGSYLYKDILTWERIMKPEKLERLVQALSFQVGQQVSYHELGQTCGLDNETVEKYIDLLEKAFIVFRLTSLSRNLRNELKKSRKIYFYDNGLRNAVINQFSPINLRNDKGQLWENWLVSERMKLLHYKELSPNRYFWRTVSQQEIDYLEERNGMFKAFEFKYNSRKPVRFSSSFINNYAVKSSEVISRENYEEFLMKE